MSRAIVSEGTSPASFESLEPRTLLSLIGPAIHNPIISFDSTGQIAYDATTQTFGLDATTLRFKRDGASPPTVITGTPRTTQVRLLVDNGGHLIGGVPGHDLAVYGSVDVDNDGVVDASGLLMAGEVIGFGYQDVSATDNYDFLIQPTDGALMNFFGAGLIGMTVTSEHSTFVGSFQTNFAGGAKGNIGAVAMPLSSISGSVYVDENNDGVFDATEAGIPSVSLALTGTDDLGQPVSQLATTNATGFYQFTDLRPGTYQIVEQQPTGYLDGKDTVGTPGGTTTDDQFASILLPMGYAGQNNNFGELLPASISGSVYVDENNDGVFDATETGIPGVSLALTGTDDLGQPVSQVATTDTTGFYQFVALRPGSYVVRETQPADFDDGQDTIGTPGGTTTDDQFSDIPLGLGVDGEHNNFGERVPVAVLPSSIGDYVWLDANGDGLQQPAEAGIAGIAVTLTGADANGPVSQATTTDADGFYLFDHLLSGTYTVRFVLPAGFAFTLANQGSDGTDSDADRLTGQTGTINLAAGQADLSWDAGVVVAAVHIEKYVKITTSSCGDHNNDHHGGCGDHNHDHYGGCGDHDSHGGGWSWGGCGSHNSGWSWSGCGSDKHSGWSWGSGWSGCGSHNNGSCSSQFTLSCAPTCCPTPDPNPTPDYGDDADTAPGITVEMGQTVKFTYVITNPGQTPLADVVVIDDNATPNDASDDFDPTPTLAGGYNVGDLNHDGILQVGEQWVYTATTLVTYGQHTNVAVVTGRPVDAQGRTLGENVSDDDPANWFGKAKCVAPASLAGFVYVDRDNDGVFDCDERAIGGATITLTGTNDLGQGVSLTTTTNSSGAYSFDNLRPGAYSILETQPAGYYDGKDTLGSLGGTVADDLFSNISVLAGKNGVQYNFGERCTPSNVLTCGMTATIGFWQNCNGQTLIKALNGSSCSKALGNWLAATLPNLLGSLAGKTNAQVASYYKTLFGQCGQKLEAQIMATALAAYATNSALAGGNFAAKYGFKVSAAGTGAALFNVGSNGTALGLTNNSYQTVLDILRAADNRASNGCLFKYSTSLRSQANTLFTAINETGDI